MNQQANSPTRPLSLHELAKLEAVSATEHETPLASHQVETFFSVAAGTAVEPVTQTEQIGTDTRRDLYRMSVSLPIDGLTLGLPGRTARRVELPDRSQTRDFVATDGHCPTGAPISYIPSTDTVSRPRVYSRGRRVQPVARQLLTDTSYPWRCIGRITNSQGRAGSGALVGHNLVLTASHVVPWGQSSWWMTFTPHQFGPNTQPFGMSYVSDAHAYIAAGQTVDQFDSAIDYAVLKLYTPLGDRLGWFGSTDYSEEWNDGNYWASVGYPGDMFGGVFPSVELPVSIEDGDSPGVFSNPGLNLETEAKISAGASGGPFWAWFPNGRGLTPRIAGVVSSNHDFGTFSTDIDGRLAGGSELVNLVNWGRSNWS
jgi:V8-like Glu-specific endopeptidase